MILDNALFLSSYQKGLAKDYRHEIQGSLGNPDGGCNALRTLAL